LEVSEYNKGRTNKQVSNKTWIHGTREYLRPDTIWADERWFVILWVNNNLDMQISPRLKSMKRKKEILRESKAKF